MSGIEQYTGPLIKQKGHTQSEIAKVIGMSQRLPETASVYIKKELAERLLETNAFWSYNHVRAENIPDEELIEKTFIYLDLGDIAKLFELYPRNYIRKIWREQMVVQGDYLFNLNVMIALYYFDIKHPEKYLKRVEREQLKRKLTYG